LISVRIANPTSLRSVPMCRLPCVRFKAYVFSAKEVPIGHLGGAKRCSFPPGSGQPGCTALGAETLGP